MAPALPQGARNTGLVGRIARYDRSMHRADVRIGVAPRCVMNDAAVVPDHEIPVLPLVAVEEFFADLMGKEAIEDFVGLLLRQPFDADGEAGRDVKRLPSGFRMGAHQRPYLVGNGLLPLVEVLP